jgi:hypothetical protein
VHVGSKYLVCDTSTAKQSAMPQRVQDFKLRYLPNKYHDGPREHSLGDIWLNWADRRQYAGDLVFKPMGAEIDESSDDFNTWRGFRIEPKRGDWSLFQVHLRDIVCPRRRTLQRLPAQVFPPTWCSSPAASRRGHRDPRAAGHRQTIVYKMLETPVPPIQPCAIRTLDPHHWHLQLAPRREDWVMRRRGLLRKGQTDRRYP